jgi:hypothetical protein
MGLAPTVEPESPSRIEKPDEQSGGGNANSFVGLQEDPRWLSVQRLIHTESFAKASRLSSFLLYIVERFLQGRTEEITEQQIGVHVFGRPANYNPGDDNIVRQTARQLRQRLALYYQEEGRTEPIQVVIPRGGYIPQFQYTTAATTPIESTNVDPTSEAPPDRDSTGSRENLPPTPLPTTGAAGRRVKPAVLVALGVTLGVGLALLGSYGRHRLLFPWTERDKLWNLLLTADQRTLVVPGDAGINMYGNLARTQVDVWEYGSSSYLSKPEAQTPPGFTWSPFADRRYTTISDLKFVSALQDLPNANRSRMELRFARDIKSQDLKDANAILIGSPNYDPWIQLFDKDQNFRMVYNGTQNTITIFNRAPLKGEQASYKWSESDPQRTGYALISLTDNLGSTGKVLLVEGTTLGGVDAATDFLFHSPQMDTIVRDAIGKSGKPSNFELLLETTLYLGDSERAKVVAERVHPIP